MPETLSVTIITKNEAANIEDCIKSIQPYANEIIVLDCGSTDGTQDICRSLGAIVEDTDWPGDGPQKNRALDRAKCDWILSIDADERVTPELGAEIMSVLTKGTTHSAFRIPRRSLFCGRFMKHSGWWPDYVIRLIRRGKGRFTETTVHPSIKHEGSLGTFKNPFIHLTAPVLHRQLEKMNNYTTAGAFDLKTKGRKAGIITAVLHGWWMFFRTYILKLGFLDGREGFVLAVFNAESSYYKYVKLALKQTETGKQG